MAAAATRPMSPSNTSASNDAPVKMEVNEVNHALTPPASEEHNKRENSSSDLSELDFDPSDDVGEIEPAYYFGGGKIPVFEPTMEQFKDFKKFIDKIDKYGMKSGVVKVVPPKEWRDNLPALDEMVKTIKVKNPITQEFHGSQGTWTQANMEKQRTYNLPQWRTVCEESNHQPPAKRGERRRNQERVSRATPTRTAKPAAPPPAPGQKRPRGRPRKNPLPEPVQSIEPSEESKEATENPQTPQTPEPSPAKATPSKSAKPRTSAPSDREDTPKAKGRQPKSVSSRRLRNKGETADVIDEEAFKDFDYRIHDQAQWTIDRCKELESAYWKSLTFNNPMYGADMPGSLFKDDCDVWNVAKLPNLLDVLGQKVPGVNTAYLYLGMWKATFAWHLEDVDLYSINYIHFGAPKQWYSISQEDARRFEKAMKTIWPQDAKNCDQFLRHKTYLISPQLLKSQFNIEVNRMVHYEGEFVITYPYGYHSGYNLGYNCAESVNFANEAWLEYGKVARKCNCEDDSVWIDVYDVERKLRGERTPEYYETEVEIDEDDEDGLAGSILTPPDSVKADAKSRSKKRKRDPSDKSDKTKVKKLRIKVAVPIKEPCCLCPHDPPFEELLPTDTQREAHRRCAAYTPETRIIDVDGKEMICGVADIDKARLNLKCYFCRSKKGSVFQCSEKKCVRAYHASCAIAAGVQVDTGPVPVFMEDGTEYFEEGHDFRCKIHRDNKKVKYDDLKEYVASLQANSRIRRSASKLTKGDLVQARYHYGDFYGGYVLENWVDEESLLIEVYPKRDKMEVSYAWLQFPDPANSKRPKPSPDAKPLPKELYTSVKTNEDPADIDKPKPDDLFTPESTYKWGPLECFNSVKLERNPDTVHVDLTKSKSTWLYLGQTSTEAKAQYTSNPAVLQHDPSSSFLDSVKPPVPRPQPPRSSYTNAYPSGVNVNAVNAVRHNHGIQVPRAIPPPGKRNAQPPLVAKPPAIAGGHVDPEALKNQQAFLQQSATGFKPYELGGLLQNAGKRHTHSMSDVTRRPSQPAISVETFRKWTQEAFQSFRPMTATAASASRVTGPPGLQANHSSQLSAGSNDKMSPPHRPVFSRSPSAQPPGKQNLLTPPSTSDSSGGGLRSRSDSLKALAKWPFIYEKAAQRPHVYHSPYSANGGYTEAAYGSDALQMPQQAPQTRSRSTSLMQDFLQKASPSQLQAVRGHARTVSTDKAVAKAREAERRMSESISRQQRLTGGAMSPIEMLPEAMLGDLGRPGSSGVFSDRASPFPEFNTHSHPVQASDELSPPAGTINLPAISNNLHPNPDAPTLPSSINLNTASLANLHYPRPTRTLNQHIPRGMHTSTVDFSRQIEQTSAQYPMGTKQSSYNKSMRDLEAAATVEPLLKYPMSQTIENFNNGGSAVLDAGEPGPSFVHGHPVGVPQPQLVPDGKVETINPMSIAPAGTDPPIQGSQTSPLRETFGKGGGEMLPVMEQESFLS